MGNLIKIKRALLSLSDKTGAVAFASKLVEFGVEIVSTGGTATTLRDAGISVKDVSDITGFPEMMDGRVKTLHPNIHGALLAVRDNPDHATALEIHDISPIDLVIVNLYPFRETIADANVTLDAAIENIDIGGPAMIRSAAKNWKDVAVVTNPDLYQQVIDELSENGGSLSLGTRQNFAVLAFALTASYDLAISSFLASQLSEKSLSSIEPFNPLADFLFIQNNELDSKSEPTNTVTLFPDSRIIELEKAVDLRYGENPHQSAALYLQPDGLGVANAEQLSGKEMSFNNYVDADAAWKLVSDFDDCGVAIIKHTNPSGVGVGASPAEAYSRALSTDPISAFGGIVAFNRQVDDAAAAAVVETFTEVVIAPEFSDEALTIFSTKKNLRVLRIQIDQDSIRDAIEHTEISGGMLVQTRDSRSITVGELKVVSDMLPTDGDLAAMLFAWKVCKHVKSNAIVIASADRTLGVGSGQMNRVDSIRIAAMRAKRFDLNVRGAALASDAFFPFRDNVDEAAALGIGSIIQPGGSMKDQESIDAANEHGLIMAFTSIRHFNH